MRFLFASFEGGGHVPPAILVARRLREAGHDVLFLSDDANRAEAAAAGLSFGAWRRAPNRAAAGSTEDPLRDWQARLPPAIVRAILDAVIAGPAAAYAADALDAIERFRPDAVIANELLFGVMAAAERRGVPLALLTANVWCFPTRDDVPPFGPGFAPGQGRFGRWLAAGRDRNLRAMMGRWYDQGLPALNAAREGLGLAPLPRLLDQLGAAALIMLGTARAFDIGDGAAPPPFAYAGPLGGMPDWARAAAAPEALARPGPPLVLVSFSTTFQDQARTIARGINALAGMPVRGIVTLGPAIGPEALPQAANVAVLRQAPHDAIVPHCAAMLSHGGHGTVVRALLHGVPVVALPMGRDHPENARRIAARGAGLRLPRNAGTWRIRAALRRVLEEPGFRTAASALGDAIRAEADEGRAAAAAFTALAEGAYASGSSLRTASRA